MPVKLVQFLNARTPIVVTAYDTPAIVTVDGRVSVPDVNVVPTIEAVCDEVSNEYIICEMVILIIVL